MASLSSSLESTHLAQEKELPKGSETFQIVISELMAEKMLSNLHLTRSDYEDEEHGDETAHRCLRRRNTISNSKALKDRRLSLKNAVDIFRRRKSIAFGTKCNLVESEDNALQ